MGRHFWHERGLRHSGLRIDLQDDEITRSRSRDAMRRDEPTHGDKPADGRLALGEAIKRMGW